MALNHHLLFYFVRDALIPYSEDFRIIERNNPVRFGLNTRQYSAHVSYVHDSGNSRKNPDERRIQIARKSIEEQRSRQKKGDRVAFMGFFDRGDVFVAWDPRHVFSLNAETRDSVYARQSQQERVLASQAAVYQFKSVGLDQQSFAIALPASALGFYLENIERFHTLPTEDAIVRLMAGHLEAFSDVGLGKGGEIKVEENGKREKFTYQRTAYPRDPRFKHQVLEAYEQACCICGRQLAIVQAAHIIPHNVDDSPDEVTNGLALCVEHHRLYDDVLLLPGPEYRLVFNTHRAKFLSETGQDKGLSEVRKNDGKRFTVPEDPAKRPREEYLRRGLKIRLDS